jgi:hypothetical protein
MFSGSQFFGKSDFSRANFQGEASRGGRKVEYDKFKIVNDRLLEDKIEEGDDSTTNDSYLGSVKAVYREVLENYEYRMRYDEAGQLGLEETYSL